MTPNKHTAINYVKAGGKHMTSKYVRSNDKMIAGVCSLIAKETGIDVGLVRVITAVLAVVTSGIALIAYLIAWAVLPAEGQTTTFMDKAVGEGQKFYEQQKAKKADRPGAEPGPSAPTPFQRTPAAPQRTSDPDPFDLYKD